MIDPQKSISTVDNEMISLRVKLEGTTKYAGIKGRVGVIMNVKFQFKDNKIRISGAWTETSWMGNDVDVFTFLSKGGLKIYNSKGEIKNQKRFIEYNKMTNDFIQSILNDDPQDEW
ncbi:MAG: hypothetical protein NC241_05655 [Bacteroides sp.]|nr:hypothetical protein [Bacteroides sp.]MCM1456654.1 hypothetical protein [Lachnoclostridium sp.]